MKQLSKTLNAMKIRLIFSLALMLSTWAVQAAHEDYFISANLDSMSAGDTLTLRDPQFPLPPYPGNLNWDNGTGIVSNVGRVVLAIDHTNGICPDDAFSFTVQIRIESWDDDFNYTTKDTILTVSYNTSATQIYHDKDVYLVQGDHYIKTTILGISDPTYKQYVALQLYLNLERYYDFDPTVIPAFNIVSATTYDINLQWNPIDGAEYYDLEWTYVDDYNGTGSYFTTSQLDFDFRNNSSRISTSQTQFILSKTFEHGYVLFRVRGVGKGGTNYIYNVPGVWSSATSGKVNTNANRIAITSPHEPNLNWQFVASYAEEGKKKEMIIYFDGSLRNRQTVTLLNTQATAMVAETFYDHQGRAALSALPVPSYENILKYYPQFNVRQPNLPYNRTHFDIETSACAAFADAMDTVSGASRYYSINNDSQQYFQAYVPVANGYPFIQTEFQPDNTGRIRRQSGVGLDHRLGSGHETRYFYGTPFQEDLDRLFGTEVGYSKHYKKNMVIDANGQVSVSYVDAKGNTIATAMAGDSTAGLYSLPSNTGTAPVTRNLLDNDKIRLEEKALVATNTLLVTSDGFYTFDYEMEGDTLRDLCIATDFCYNCVYDLVLSVEDQCGDEMLPSGPIRRTIGKLNGEIDTTCAPGTRSYSFANDSGIGGPIDVMLTKGSYVVTRKLIINEEALDYYAERYIEDNTCLKTLADFENEALAAINFAGCFMDCQDCRNQLGSESNYLERYINNMVGSLRVPNAADTATALAEYADAVLQCDELCDTIGNMCDAGLAMLRTDMIPGGQYAKYDLTDTSSIFATSGMRSYTTPSSDYLDEFGQPDSVEVYVYNATTWEYELQRTDPRDLSPGQFYANWKSSWLDALVPLHPEYCHYQWCITNDASNQYDINMLETETFAAAFDSGYLNPTNLSKDPTIYNVNIQDPYFTSGPGVADKNSMNDSLNSYNQIDVFSTRFGFVPGTINIDMWEAAALTVNCPGQTNAVGIANCLSSKPFGTTSGSGDCGSLLDRQWHTFRALYLASKQALMKARIEQTCQTGWIANDTSKTARYPEVYETLGIDPNDVLASAEHMVDSAMDAQCQQQCESYAQYWMEKLEGCTYASGTDSTNLANTLISICQRGCDATSPFGASTVSPDNESPSLPNSFYEALTDAGLFQTGICDDILITMPMPYGHDYFAGESPFADTCACDSALYDLSVYDCRDTITVHFNDCVCEDAPTAGIKTSTLMTMGVEEQFKCSNCINCDSLQLALQEFDLRYPDFDETVYADQLLFQQFMNVYFSFNMFFDDYADFAARCLEIEVHDTIIQQYRNQYGATASLTEPEWFQAFPQGIMLDIPMEQASNGRSMKVRLWKESDFMEMASYAMASPPPGQPSNLDTCACNKIFRANNLVPTPHPDLQTAFQALYGETVDDIDTLLWICCQAYNGNTTAGAYPGVPEPEPCTYSWDPNQAWQTHQTDALDQLNNDNLGHDFPTSLTCDGGPDTTPADLDTCACNELTRLKEEWLNSSSTLSFADYFTQEKGYSVPDIDEITDTCAYFMGRDLDNPDARVDGWEKLQRYLLRVYQREMGTQVPRDLVCEPPVEEPDPNNPPQGNNPPKDPIVPTETVPRPPCDSVVKYAKQFDVLFKAEHGADANDLFDTDPYYKELRAYLNNIFKNHPDYKGFEEGIMWYLAMLFNCDDPDGSSSTTDYDFSRGRRCILCYDTLETNLSAMKAYLNQLGKDQKHLLMASGYNMYTNEIDSFYNSVLYSGTCPTSLIYRILDIRRGRILDIQKTESCNYEGNMQLSLDSNKWNLDRILRFDSIVPFNYRTCKSSNLFKIRAIIEVYGGDDDTTWMRGYTDFAPMVQAKQCDPCVLLCNRPMYPSFDIDSSCVDHLRDIAYLNAQTAYQAYLDSVTLTFKKRYADSCLASVKSERFEASFDQSEFHYTLYYYDQANNLIKTVPPAGVRPIADQDSLDQVVNNRAGNTPTGIHPAHILVTGYQYNSLNQLRTQETPDGGVSKFWYDQVGRMIVSQNAQQSLDNRYSYTRYDILGRAREVGVCEQATAPNQANFSVGGYFVSNWMNGRTNFAEITKTFYDSVAFNVGGFVQQHLRDRVSSVIYQDSAAADTIYRFATHYSYDIHGSVKDLLQENTYLDDLDQQYKHLSYDHDLISGNMLRVRYQEGEIDQFYHRYEYDADNRITDAYTSTDGLFWDRDAQYFYYHHGPLARAELGELKVQGVDYAYTIHGWIKGVNSNTLRHTRDMGRDGNYNLASGDTTNHYVARDAFGFTLGYYEDDYEAISQPGQSQHFEANTSGSRIGNSSYSMYNGNIRYMVTAIGKFMEGGQAPLAFSYHYDQLSRLVKARAFDNIDQNANQWQSSSAMSDYRNTFTYDANGNILTQQRKGVTSINLGLDNLTYEYYSGTNRLRRVRDVVGAGKYDDDIDDQLAANNYQYDAIGNLIRDVAEEIDTIVWTTYGKVKEIRRVSGSDKPDLEFFYGPAGKRVMKIVKSNIQPGFWTYTYYTHNAQGDIMATYRRHYQREFDYEALNFAQVNDSLIQLAGADSFELFILQVNHPPGLLTLAQEYATYITNVLDQEQNFLNSCPIDSFFNWDATLLDSVLANYDINIFIQAMIAKDGLAAYLTELCNYNIQHLVESFFNYDANSYLTALSTTDIAQFNNLWQFFGRPAMATVQDQINDLLTNVTHQDIINQLVSYGCSVNTTVMEQTGSASLVLVNYHTDHDLILATQNVHTDAWIKDALEAYDATYLRSIIYAQYAAGALINDFANTYPEAFLAKALELYPGVMGALQDENEYYSMENYFNDILNFYGNTRYNQLIQKFRALSNSYSEHFTLQEWHLYGASRLGVQSPQRAIASRAFEADYNSATGVYENLVLKDSTGYHPDTLQYHLNRGEMAYELSNHLGNVLAVVSDKRSCIDSTGNGITDWYEAVVIQANDYSAFGAPLPERSWEADTTATYRFGFNGMENEGEVSGRGNSYSTEYRQYNARLGRWFSLDPLMAKYPDQSPYAAFNNNPLFFADPTGLEGETKVREAHITSSVDAAKQTTITQTVTNIVTKVNDDGSKTVTKTVTKVQNFVGNYEETDEKYYEPLKDGKVATVTSVDYYNTEGKHVKTVVTELKEIDRSEYTGDLSLLNRWTDHISDFNKSNGSDETWSERNYRYNGYALAASAAGAALPFGLEILAANKAGAAWVGSRVPFNVAEGVTLVGGPTTGAGLTKLTAEAIYDYFTPSDNSIHLSAGKAINGLISAAPTEPTRSFVKPGLIELQRKYKKLLLD